MTSPDFTPHGYLAVKELGRNTTGFRTTYQGVDVSSNELVVIKHFEVLPKNIDDWNNLNKMYDEEIQALKGLKHPNIPYFIESFQLQDSSRCIALEYKKGRTLAETRSFSPDEVKNISVSLLEILIYLQDQVPSIKHRDIKPENILVDDVNNSLEVHLVDFGFARIGDGEAKTFSSTIKGTFGFMAPEQFRNKNLSNSSDLYGLGATLICLLTGTKSNDIDKLTDDYNYIRFKKLVPGLSLLFIRWLEKMVEPDPSQRYPDAKTALRELRPLYVRRIPEAVISTNVLEFRAIKLGEKISQNIKVVNSIPDTVLLGIWGVVSHPNDLRGTGERESHSWISFKASKFSGNSVECKVLVDTAKLMASKTYKRQITLHSNSLTENQIINVIVYTDSLPVKVKTPPYWFIFLSFVSPLLILIPIIVWTCISPLLSAYDSYANAHRWANLNSKDLIVYGAIGGPFTLALILLFFALTLLFVVINWLACNILIYVASQCSNEHSGILIAIAEGFLCSLFGASITWGSLIWIPRIIPVFYDIYVAYVNAFSEKQASLLEGIFATVTPFILGVSLIIVFVVDSQSSVAESARIAIALSGVLLLGYLLSPRILRQIRISKYRASEGKLIKP